jgi:hypothetical protein
MFELRGAASFAQKALDFFLRGGLPARCTLSATTRSSRGSQAWNT